jgi:hypothetical protein
MMHCAKEKGLDYCFECKEFPCDFVTAFASDGAAHHKKTVENMKRARAIGLNAWIAEQAEKAPSFCP